MKGVPSPQAELTIEVTVNGARHVREVPVRRLLSDFLRDDLGLTGTHVGCEQGICGACTVLVDGRPSRSCLMFAVQADGGSVTTIEGTTPATGLSRLQQALKDHHGLQCGFCTPGIVMTLSGVETPETPDDRAVRELLAGNLCRCTGYQGIVEAVLDAWGSESDAGREAREGSA
jgi:aerobic carbon-monoxide dehydrogenase small subunit